MKMKIIYLSMILLTFAVASCEKEKIQEPQQTLEQLYPDWKNLTWVATYDNKTNEQMQYPRVDIKIVGNVVTITSQVFYYETPIVNTYNKITIENGNLIEFRKDYDYTEVYRFEKNGDEMILNNDTISLFRYVMKIN